LGGLKKGEWGDKADSIQWTVGGNPFFEPGLSVALPLKPFQEQPPPKGPLETVPNAQMLAWQGPLSVWALTCFTLSYGGVTALNRRLF
jgi:hypothetical protein